ncbi:hypothetical protein PFISCL1PPCAC_12280, partial [Pristionchus fissidentatus]
NVSGETKKETTPTPFGKSGKSKKNKKGKAAGKDDKQSLIDTDDEEEDGQNSGSVLLHNANDEEETEEEKGLRFDRQVQLQIEADARDSLDFSCSSTFRGTRREIEALRSLLVATETKKQIEKALTDVKKGGAVPLPGSQVLDLSQIRVQLSNYAIDHPGVEDYFVVILRHRL